MSSQPPTARELIEAVRAADARGHYMDGDHTARAEFNRRARDSFALALEALETARLNATAIVGGAVRDMPTINRMMHDTLIEVGRALSAMNGVTHE